MLTIYRAVMHRDPESETEYQNYWSAHVDGASLQHQTLCSEYWAFHDQYHPRLLAAQTGSDADELLLYETLHWSNYAVYTHLNSASEQLNHLRIERAEAPLQRLAYFYWSLGSARDQLARLVWLTFGLHEPDTSRGGLKPSNRQQYGSLHGYDKDRSTGQIARWWLADKLSSVAASRPSAGSMANAIAPAHDLQLSPRNEGWYWLLNSIRNDITHGSLPFLGVCDRSGPWHMVNVAMPTSERAVYVRELAPAGEPTLLTTSDTYPCCIDRQCDYFLAKLCALADDMWAALAAGFSNDELPAPRGT